MKGKGCHDALAKVNQTFARVDWFVERDISNFFPEIHHGILLNIIEERIDDKKFSALLRRVLKVLMYDSARRSSQMTKLRIPQGSILSPILANIYLDQLDKFVLLLIEGVNALNELEGRNAKSVESLKYSRIRKRRYKLIKKLKQPGITFNDRKAILAEFKKLREELLNTLRIDPEKKPFRISYVRYGDDFLIRIAGPKGMAIEFKRLLTDFLKTKLHLELNKDKTLITHARSGQAKFLRYLVSVRSSSDSSGRVRKVVTTSRKRVTKRTTSRTVSLNINHERVVNKLVERRFAKFDRNRKI
jgi:retron-type reverse transcriptase